MPGDEFTSVRGETDPLEQARRATELLSVYQQRATELARLRKLAIERAAAERHMSFAAVAAAVGISKGRVTQIRQSAPPAERGFFGVGPVTVAIPERTMPGRALPVVATEDTRCAAAVTTLLEQLHFQVRPALVPAVGGWEPPAGDVVAICGPKSSSRVATLLAADPLLRFAATDAGRWFLAEADGDRSWHSGMDGDPPHDDDVAYLGRLPRAEGTLLVIAGVHAIGSLGAVTWLAAHLAELHDQVGAAPFSMVVRCTHAAGAIRTAEAATSPRPY